jgi:hypothetical protein
MPEIDPMESKRAAAPIGPVCSGSTIPSEDELGMEDWQIATVALTNRERVNTKALTYIENHSLRMLEGDAGIKQGSRSGNRYRSAQHIAVALQHQMNVKVASCPEP